MSEPHTEQHAKPVKKPKFLKIFAGILGFIVFLLAFAWLALPSIIASQAPKFVLEKSGHVLAFDKPQINPLALSVHLPKLTLTTPEGEQLAAFEHLFVDVSGTDLLAGTISLDAVELNGLNLNAALLPNGDLNWTALINAFKNPEPEPDTEPPPFKLGHLNIVNASVGVEDRRRANGFKTRLEPLNLELRNLSTKANREGKFELDAKTGFDADFKISSTVVLSEPAFVGELSLNGTDLAKLENLLKPLLPVAPPSGTVNASLAFDVRLPGGKPAVQISKLNVDVNQLKVSVKEGGKQPAVKLGKLAVSDASFDLQSQQAKVAGIALNNLEAVHANGQNALAVNSLAVGEVNVDLAAQHAKVAGVKLEGANTTILRNKNGEIDLQAWVEPWTQLQPKQTGSTPEPEKKTEPAKPWTYAVNTIALGGMNVKFRDESLQPALAVGVNNIQVEASGVTQDLSKPLPLKASLSVEGGGTLNASGTATPASAAVAMNLDLQNLGLKLAQPFIGQAVKLELVSGTASSKGMLNHSSKGTEYTGNFAVNNLRLNEKGSNKSFLAFKSLNSPALTASTQAVRISRLNLRGLDTAILIAKDKSTNINRILVEAPSKPQAAAAPAGTPSKAAAPEFSLNIDRFAITESELDFADESLFIPFGTRIHDLKGSLTGISNKPGSRGELALDGQIDEFGLAQAEGKLDLFDPTAFLDIRVNFQNVEMAGLTPYSATFANRKVNSGKLSLNLEYNIQNKQLNSNNQVIIDKLVLGERVKSPQGTDLPLDLAIAILEDSDGRIDLGLPVTGSLDDPQFSLGALAWKAFTNVLTKIVTAPFRALGSLFGGEESLGSLAFQPGANALSPPQRESLKKLGAAMTKRPNLALTIHGTWANADKTAIQAQQLRRAVALQAGDKLEATEEPGPLALQSPNVQKALEALFTKRLGGGELASLKDGFRKANPGELQQNAAGQALAQVSNLFKETRKLSDAEVAALKGKDFYAVLAQKLQDAEVVTDEQLKALAKTRQTKAIEGLVAAGVDAGRLTTGELKRTEVDEKKAVPLGLDIAAKK